MTDYIAPLDDMRFLMNDVFAAPELWQRLPALAEHVDPDTANAILDEAAKIMSAVLHPLNQPADEHGCIWHNGQVTSPPGFKEAYQLYIEGGWNSLVGDPNYGGMNMPKTLVSHVEEMLQASGLAFGLVPMLTAGACLALSAHGSDELKERYLAKMIEGVWTGAMDLTEPHAGTDLGLIRTKAVPNDDGSYAVTGTKIFITWGEHDLTENIIHLVLAKLPDAPAGSRGISMFLVPKMLVDDQGNITAANQLSCGSIEHKMGIHGSATCVMNFDGAKGWLVGEPNKGLAAMFTMMNDERLAVGIQGLGVADLAYQQASRYARERRQGRNPAGAQEPDQVADSLLVHGDVRRMLLSIRAFNEASRAFLMYISQWLDIEKYSEDAQEREHATHMVDLLTPVAKAFISDKAFDSTVLAQQVLGGHGYIKEWGVEQLVRDARIAQIYEGANGIQAMDLLGRKIVGGEGKLLALFVDDVKQFLAEHSDQDALSIYTQALTRLLQNLEQLSQQLIEKAVKDPHVVGAAANNYLHFFGYVACLYMWAKMIAATAGKDDDFHRVKRVVGQFYVDYLLPQADALQLMIQSETTAVTALHNDDF